jgi:thioredoxin-related protein
MIAYFRFRRTFAALILAVLAGLACLPAAASAAELVVFGSARCPYCLAWEREIGNTYAKTGEARQAPLRRIDIEEELPADLARLRDVDVTPTFVLVEKGREIGRIVGYSGSRSFWPELRRLLAKLQPRQM